MPSRVYFYPISKDNVKDSGRIAALLLRRLVKEENIKPEKEIPIKIHVGELGDTSHVKL